MDYVNLGRSGLKVSRICLGMMNFGDPNWREWILPEAAARPIVQRALELGINFFDTADMYSGGLSEEITGRLLLQNTRREEVVIATKVYMPTGQGVNQRGLSRAHILQAVEASLRRLGTDYIDLYQIHRFDPETPVEETLSTLDGLVRAGKVRYLGASSMGAWQFAKHLYTGERHGWTRFVAMQNHYNLVYREEEREMLPLCREEGVGVIPWSPLARGFLTGTRRRDGGGETVRAQNDGHARRYYYRPADFNVVERVQQLAAARGVTPAQVALAWLLHQPGIAAPIVGANRREYVEQAAAAVELRLSPEECRTLEAPYQAKENLLYHHAFTDELLSPGARLESSAAGRSAPQGQGE
ncbi:MAG: aldo/keto reductase [Anaerolineales bacterium]|nr:aldo/keto reductase [Anaerolineales bacterium]